MDFTKFLIEQALVLVPALYVVGLILKNTEKIADKIIPVVLLPLGILGAIALMGVSADAIIQGILVTGVTVFSNQLVKQITKTEV